MKEDIHALILIVDDNPQNLQILGSILRKNGYKVAAAQNGLQALDFISKKLPDLILLDIMLVYGNDDDSNPEIKDHEVDYGRKMGLYVYQKIRGLQNPPPILLVSVVDDYAVLSEFPDVVGHLAKYFKLDDLSEMVLACLKESRHL